MVAAPQIDPARKKRLEESFVKHAALAQFYRWCQSRNPHAHGVRSHHVDVGPDGCIALTAELDRYEGTAYKTPMRCAAKMAPVDGALPGLVEMEVVPVGNVQTGNFDDPHATNRVMSLIHHFTSLVENPARDPDPFRELLVDDFALHYVDPPVAGWAMLDDWVTGRLASVVASQHLIHDVSFRAGRSGYVATIAMESEALFPDSSGIISKNRQTWRIVDDPAENYARIREVRIDRDAVHRFDLPDAD